MSEFFSVTLNKDIVLDDSIIGMDTGWSSYHINQKISELNEKIKSEELTTETLNKTFSNITFTTIADLNSINDTILNSIIDITNTSPIKNLSFQIIAEEIILYGGIIPPQRTISFDTQRNNLIIKVNGDGTINMITKILKEVQ
ncbi:hypothetical protein ACMXKO_11000 [Clostridium tyrobutyricum]|uniref:hypothetical protein n=1 Tax=Clostridium tyrobutyricum TaxID=1519 RepID=UPI0039F69B94